MTPIPRLSLADHHRIHIVGVKGVAMAGIATMLTQMGYEVSGSDTSEEQITDIQRQAASYELRALDADLDPSVDLVIYSAAHGGVESHQVVQARERGIMTAHQALVIQALCDMHPASIAICGCHGKTGTTALTVHTLRELGLPVSWLVGTASFYGRDESGATIGYAGAHYDPDALYMVYECDEYAVSPPHDLTPKLEYYHPTYAICTNIDYDHPDVYRDLAHTTEVFRRFFTRCEWVYECHSSSVAGNATGVKALITQIKNEKLKMKNSVGNSGINTTQPDQLREQSRLDHADIDVIISRFGGAKRRLEDYGEYGEVQYYDDYAHHPAEIEATLQVLKGRHPGRRILALFQSHTYSRTYALREEFVRALAQADLVYIDQVFPSAREPADVTKISSHDLEVIARSHGIAHIHGCESRDDLLTRVRPEIRPGDIVLTLGAGDIYKAMSQLIPTH